MAPEAKAFDNFRNPTDLGEQRRQLIRRHIEGLTSFIVRSLTSDGEMPRAVLPEHTLAGFIADRGTIHPIYGIGLRVQEPIVLCDHDLQQTALDVFVSSDGNFEIPNSVIVQWHAQDNMLHEFPLTGAEYVFLRASKISMGYMAIDHLIGSLEHGKGSDNQTIWTGLIKGLYAAAGEQLTPVQMKGLFDFFPPPQTSQSSV